MKVLRVSGMPHGVQVWIDDQPHRLEIYVDEQLITEVGARLLESVLSANVHYWRRQPTCENRLVLHTYAG